MVREQLACWTERAIYLRGEVEGYHLEENCD